MSAGRGITYNISRTWIFANDLTLNALGMWEYMYKSTKLPCVPMYGLFPVKLRTHIGTPIYPTPDMTPEDLSKAAAEAVQKLISQHQILPGNLTQVS